MIRETDGTLYELASLQVNTANCINYSVGPMLLPSWQKIEEMKLRTRMETCFLVSDLKVAFPQQLSKLEAN